MNEKFELLGIGTAIISHNNLKCNFFIKSSSFFRKYNRTISKMLTKPLISTLKKSIQQKNNPVSYNSRYNRTYRDFFKKIQLESFQNDTQTAVKLENGFDHLDHLGKLKYREFLTKRQNDAFLSERKILDESYEKIPSIFPSLKRIIDLIDKGKLKDARLLLQKIPNNPEYTDLPKEIKNRLVIFAQYLEIVTQEQKVLHTFSLNKIQDTYDGLEDVKLQLIKLDHSYELIRILDDNFSDLYQDIKTTRQNMLSSIHTYLVELNQLRNSNEYYEALTLCERIKDNANSLNLEGIQDFANQTEKDLIYEYQIFQSLLYFTQKQFSRIHIGELEESTGIPRKTIIKIIQQLIENSRIKAKYDPISQGIELQYLQTEIDQLFKQFEEWECLGVGKKQSLIE